MALSKEKKQEILNKLGDIVKKAKSIVFVNFHGLSVADANELRSQLREAGVDYTVAKKTLIRKALEATKFGGEVPNLDGELALAYGVDNLAPAKGIYDFQQTHKEKVQILGGIFEGEYRDKLSMNEIAAIPGRDVLIAQILNVINSPIQGLVIALDAIASNK